MHFIPEVMHQTIVLLFHNEVRGGPAAMETKHVTKYEFGDKIRKLCSLANVLIIRITELHF